MAVSHDPPLFLSESRSPLTPPCRVAVLEDSSGKKGSVCLPGEPFTSSTSSLGRDVLQVVMVGGGRSQAFSVQAFLHVGRLQRRWPGRAQCGAGRARESWKKKDRFSPGLPGSALASGEGCRVPLGGCLSHCCLRLTPLREDLTSPPERREKRNRSLQGARPRYGMLIDWTTNWSSRNSPIKTEEDAYLLWSKVNTLKELIQRIDTPLHDHLSKHCVEFLQFTFRWMNNLLMRELPLHCTIRLWDTYLAEPEGFSTFHLYVCAAFLRYWSPALLRERDFQGLMLLLQNLPTYDWGNEEITLLVAEAYRLKYTFADAPNHLQARK
ncbi:hypothetical protein MTO96_030585 [Rhipicephalus appendiculatus]